MNKQYNFFASSPKATEDLLAKELKEFGADDIKMSISGVYFKGSLQTAYRACLWSRITNQLYFILKDFEINTKDLIYKESSFINWEEHFDVDDTFAVSCTMSATNIVKHNHYGALLVKDAIADSFREKYGKRPSINKDDPDVMIHLHLDKTRALLSINLSGNSLHKRGYRQAKGVATLKENIAAAMLMRANWANIAMNNGSFIDPMCGTGTLPIEAAMIAGDIAPGILREKYGFIKWKKHKDDIWQSLLLECQQRKEKGLSKIPQIIGYDNERLSIAATHINIKAIGLDGYIHLEKKSLREIIPTEKNKNNPGLMASDPPYGHRLGNKDELFTFYNEFGNILRERFENWKVAVIVGDKELYRSIGLKASKTNTLYNGAIKCVLAQFEIFSTKDRQVNIKAIRKNKIE